MGDEPSSTARESCRNGRSLRQQQPCREVPQDLELSPIIVLQSRCEVCIDVTDVTDVTDFWILLDITDVTDITDFLLSINFL